MNTREFNVAWTEARGPSDEQNDNTPVVVSVPGIGPCKVVSVEKEQHSDSFAGDETIWIKAEEM